LKILAGALAVGIAASAPFTLAAEDTAPRRPQTYRPVFEQPKKPATYRPKVERPSPPRTYPLTAAPSSSGAKPSAPRSEQKPQPITVIR
jgi:hypothetical protein